MIAPAVSKGALKAMSGQVRSWRFHARTTWTLDGLAEAQTGEHLAEPSALKDAIHNSVVNFLYERTKRRPMVLPVIMQV